MNDRSLTWYSFVVNVFFAIFFAGLGVGFFCLKAAWLNGSLSGRSPFCQLNEVKKGNHRR